MTYSAVPGDLQPVSPKGARFHRALATHRFEGIFDNPDERARLVADLGARNAALLENHGYLVCAPSVARCWSLLYDLEQATLAHLAALATGAPLLASPAGAVAADKARLDAEEDAFIDERWASQLRLLDRSDPSFRD